MATKERKEREKARDKRKKEDDKKWDKIISEAPDHVKKRLGQESKLGEQLHTKGQRKVNSKGQQKANSKGQHEAFWAKYDENGQYIARQDPEGLGANSIRRDDREASAQDLRERYPYLWGERGGAIKVVAEEHRRRAERPKGEDESDYPNPPTVGTVRRYMRDFPI